MRVVLDFLDGAGWLVVVLLIVVVALVSRRSVLVRRGATLHCGLRLDITKPNRVWQTGMARYTNEDLEWFRLLSLRYQPNCTFVRRSAQIVGRRYPHGAELLAVPHGAIAITCNVITRNGVTRNGVTRQGRSRDIELAMSEAAVTGFLAWIESSAPGAHTHPDTRV
jgi:Protein of unknown function (DUF2550)